MIYIFDIDGTLADLSHRIHHIQKTPKDWTAFFDGCDADEPIKSVIDTCNALYDSRAKIVLSTGRSETIREKTVDWLDDRLNGWNRLYMRGATDRREDSIVKSEILDRILEEFKQPITAVFEDRQQVVDMYRARGLRVFQVAPGDF